MSPDVSCPTRVDLAGGTIDCWPLYLLVGDCSTVNLSIDIMTRCRVEPLEGKKVQVVIKDLHYERVFSSRQECLLSLDKELSLIREHLDYWQEDRGFKVTTQSQSPVGGGLGGSSSLTISMLKAFGQFFGKNWNLNELVDVAHNIEAKVLKTPTGTQDYFPAAIPGLNAIHYSVGAPKVESLKLDPGIFNDQMLLVYTGRSHHSGINNWQVIKSAVEGDSKTLECLRAFAKISDEMLKLCRKQLWTDLPDLFAEEFRYRTQISESFCSPEISQLDEVARSEGALATKICGAGGGGCVMIWCKPGQKEQVAETCKAKGFEVLPARAVTGL